MKKRVSIKDIANTLGVSTALVSYVLNNKEKEARVGEEIAGKIRKAALELNYQPNQIAKSLKSGKSHTIGVIVADISNIFFAQIVRIIEDEAKRNQYTVIFGSSDENPEKLRNLIDVFLTRQVDGLIIVPTVGSEGQILDLKSKNIPFVLIDRYFPQIQTNHIMTDNYKAAYNAVTHLITSGCKKIGMVAYSMDLIHMQERKKGYLDAIKDHQLINAVHLIKEANHLNLKMEVERLINELVFEDSVDAVFFATNSLAINGLHCINKLNLKVPDSLAIVTFDEGEAFDFFYSPLTFVRQPTCNIGKEAIRVLLKSMVQPDFQQISIESELIVRQSSIK